MADPHEEAGIGAHVKETPTAAVYAAMMEELGVARKDTLPLDDKKGLPGRVDLDALDRGKKAYDPRTAEYKIAKENESARLAWKNAKFGDVEPEDLVLDQMNSGQSHRLRMKGTLEASRPPRGSYTTRGARGAQIGRGGGSHALSRLGRASRRSDAKSNKINVDRALSRLGARTVSNGMVRGGIRGAVRGSNAKLASRVGDNTATKGLFSFHDIKKHLSSESEPKEVQIKRKVLKPNNYNQGFGLASPEEFLSQDTSRNTGFSNVKKDYLIHDELLVIAKNVYKAATTKPKIESRSISELVEPSATLADIPEKLANPVPGGLANTTHDVVHLCSVQIGNYLGGKVIMIGPGNIHIKTFRSLPQVSRNFQIKHEGKTLLEEPLLDSIDFQLEICTISFHSGLEGKKIKWILISPNPETAANLLADLKQLQSPSTHLKSCNTSSKEFTDEGAIFEKNGHLISYLEEDPVATPVLSRFNEDLLSLMEAPLIKDILIDTQVKQNAPSLATTVVAITSKFGEIPRQQDAFRGLTTSRYAETNELSGVADSSTLSQNPLKSAPTNINKNSGERVSEETLKDICDKTAFDTIKQEPSRQYTVEELINLRPHNSFVKTSFPVIYDPKSPSESGPRFLFGFSVLDVPSVSAREANQQPSKLAKSKHTKPHIEVVLEKVIESGDIATPVSKSIQKNSRLRTPGLRALKSSRRLSTEKIGGYSEGQLVQGPAKTAKSGLSPTSFIRGSPDSASNSHRAVKALQYSAKSTDPKDLSPQPIGGLSTSKPRSNPSEKKDQIPESPSTPEHQLACSLKKLSISDHGGPIISERIAEHSKLVRPERHVNKPYQGLSTSRYATPSPTKHILKSAPTTTARMGPKTQGFVDRLSISPATVPDISNEIISRTDLTPENSNRRESFTGHISKCSNQTAKVPLQVSSLERGLDQNLSLQSFQAVPNHQSLLSTDSLSKNTSITTPVEDLINTGANKLTYSQPGISDSMLSPSSNTKVNTGRTTYSIKSGHSTDMSEFPESAKSSTLQPFPSFVEPVMSESPKSSTVPLRKTFETAKAGLMSSRYATTHEEITLGMGTGETQSHVAKTVQTVKHSLDTQRLILSVPNSRRELGHRTRALQPTATQFTPLTARDSTIQTYALPPPVMNSLSQPMQPAMATVLVPDPQCPGFLTEVCGYLKMSSTPIVGFFVNENSPTGDSSASAASQAGGVSCVPNVNSAEKTPLSLMPQDSKNVTEKQQEIQKRLSVSLAKRRHSPSPGHSGY